MCQQIHKNQPTLYYRDLFARLLNQPVLNDEKPIIEYILGCPRKCWQKVRIRSLEFPYENHGFHACFFLHVQYHPTKTNHPKIKEISWLADLPIATPWLFPPHGTIIHEQKHLWVLGRPVGSAGKRLGSVGCKHNTHRL